MRRAKGQSAVLKGYVKVRDVVSCSVLGGNSWEVIPGMGTAKGKGYSHLRELKNGCVWWNWRSEPHEQG